ncbi:MAG: protein kinase [Enhygromyxa sp.]
MRECPDPADLEAMFRGTLALDQRRHLESHLDDCDHCAQTVSELAKLFVSTSWGPALEPGSEHDAPIELGRYRLGRRLGAGGMGVVFEAHDPELDRKVAIKLLHRGSADDGERLLHEARAMARLAHPNVVAVFDVGRVGPQLFVAMELVEGTTLRQWLASDPRPDRAAILAMFTRAGHGLAAAHAIGLVHRDFKPDNVLIGADGRARVTDFGLARLIADASSDGAQETCRVGTPAYMAPEQWRGAAGDTRSDQFSFCVALYEALFGRRPFAGDSVAALARSVCEGAAEPVPRATPRWLRELFTRGLARDPAARHPDMNALLRGLERSRSRAAAIVAGAALGLLTAGLAFAWAADGPGRVAAEPKLPTTSSPSPADDCHAALVDGRGCWTGARRRALEAHLLAMDDGEQLAARTLPMLDQWIADWGRHAQASCDAPSRPLERCLERSLASFDALVQYTLDHGAFELANTIVSATHELLDTLACTDPEALSRAPAVQVDAQLDLLRDELCAIEAVIWLERWSDAQAAVELVLDRAAALGDATLLAELQLARGRIASAEGRTGDAVAALELAVEHGRASSNERVIGEAALALFVELGVVALAPEPAMRWQRMAGAHATRSGEPGFVGRLALADARVLAALGEHERALERFDAAEQALRERHGDEHPRQARLALERAATQLALADIPAALRSSERAEQLALASLGAGALLLADAKLTHARVLMAAGAHAQAEPLAREALAIYGVGRSRPRDRQRGLTLGLLGDTQAARGDFEAAAHSYTRAEAVLWEAPDAGLPSLWRGRLAIREGRLAAGLAELDTARRHFDALPPHDPRRLDLFIELGRVELQGGAIDRARATLTRAVTLADETLGFGPRRSFAQVELAQVELAAGDRERAFDLLERAHVGLAAGLGLDHPRVQEALLARADLAWELGQRDIAIGYYRVLSRTLAPKHPGLERARSRTASPSGEPSDKINPPSTEGQ